ncbi:class I SAM-dependent methyltransferase [Microcella daejeonensis]|uniref:SAM-dependent methyltransferase n=1 Tax=Microcella daejeonensis TaxID=2994971 RepID=UPI00226E601C|nr:class I SAM-dependent methyltransferase [Microcella daejeonensis]WAB84786.1 class I SAM-dependent methyltransferase [Microcella daejeonensis]
MSASGPAAAAAGPHRPADSAELAAVWDARYGAVDRLWSGRANPVLVAEAAELPPGRALDAGCGEGDDALWLAERGWTVLGVDLSSVAVARATAEAARLGLAPRASFAQRDLSVDPPAVGAFDLVSAQHLHVLPEHRGAIYGGLARAVRPGGTLLMVLHDRRDLAAGVRHPPPFSMLSEDELRAVAEGFASSTVELRARSTVARDGSPATAHDLVLRAMR